MAKQTFTAGQTLTAAQMNDLQTNDFNWSVSTQTANYTLQAADKGTREVMNMASAGTVTVPNSTFNAGDVVWVHSIGSGTITLTAGTGMTLNSSAGTAPTLAQWEGGVVYFTSASSSIFFRGGGITSANFSDAATGTYSSGGINYKYLTFTASGTLTVTRAGFADILVVGGGGGGGRATGGGGGAGGHLSITDAYLPSGALTVTVGAGGAGAVYNAAMQGENPGFNGSSSRIGAIYYGIGGGGGSSSQTYAAFTGGSGGGGAGGGTPGAARAGGAGATGQGNSGGTGSGSLSNFGAGGGGGADAVGANGTGSAGGNGGAGISTSLDNSATTRAGGGGGGAQGGTGGTGGSGGGANGTTNNSTPSNATANTGGGGGGGGYASPNGADGSNGGSGVVIVRVKV